MKLTQEQVFRGLPATHRLALTLVEAQGLRYAEVGQVLDLPAATVGRLVYEAREVLRLAAQPAPPTPTLTGELPATFAMEEPS